MITASDPGFNLATPSLPCEPLPTILVKPTGHESSTTALTRGTGTTIAVGNPTSIFDMSLLPLIVMAAHVSYGPYCW